MNESLFENQVKKILKQYPEIFPTEASFWSYLRSAFRQGLWNKSRIKLQFKNTTTSPPPLGYTGKGRKGHYCALTGEWVPVSKSEVDHIKGNVSLRSEMDIVPFIIHMLATEDELCIVGKEAHRIKSYGERMGLSFEDARATKLAISLCKNNEDKKWLENYGIVPASTKAKRREQIIKYMKENV